MAILTLGNILDDLQTAEAGLHKFERRYWMSSGHFYELYSHGLLDNGDHLEDFAEWSGHYKLERKRKAALEKLSRQRLEQLQRQSGGIIQLAPQEPVLELA
ncbi:MAG TPA: hypothetical protein G4N96_10665 [Chloroflexi bacterium]|nr:MAG: hypothetical protein B6243_07910 [Anaerolineaceae bacterium 4572_5.2]HEY85558.1 hypothetical protein [Chloroflexota bacterium]